MTTVDDVAVTAAAIRRHLDNLRADGLVDVRSVRQATGRPVDGLPMVELALRERPLTRGRR